MSNYKYPGFDKLEENSPLFRALPLCDILHSFLGERDFSYISASLFPIELVELILHYLEYDKKINSELIGDFSKKYLTEDSLYPIDELLKLWGDEKFDRMITKLKTLSDNFKNS